MSIPIRSPGLFETASVSIRFCGAEVFSISKDMNALVKEKANAESEHELTNAVALKALKEIKWQADVAAFFTRPIVAIPLAGLLLMASLFIPATTVPLAILGGVVASIASVIFGATLGITINGVLPLISETFAERSRLANRYIQELEANPDFTCRV